MESVKTDGAPQAYGRSSQAVVVGDLVFCSGLIPLHPVTRVPVTGDIVAEAERIFENLTAILAASGSDLRHVVKMTLYLTDLKDYPALNDTYDRHFADAAPARTIVQVAGLARGARIAMDCIAVRSERS